MNIKNPMRILTQEDNNSAIQKKIFINLLFISICGIILSTIIFYSLQTSIAQISTDEICVSLLNDVEARIESNNQSLEQLVEIVREDNLARARSVAMLIQMEPNLIYNIDKLNEIAAALSIDEIHIIDENGILRWGTQPFKYGMDFSAKDQTRPFLAILDDPSIEISQVPMPNASLGVIRQYAGVSLKNMKGIAEIGVVPQRMLNALEDAKIQNVLYDAALGSVGYIFSISNETGLITSHPNQDLIGTELLEPLQESGFLTIDGQKAWHHTRTIGDDIIVMVFPTADMYSQRSISTGFFLIFIIILFVLFSIIINSYIKTTVVSGILKILKTLDSITEGNLDINVEVRSNAEFNRLSNGINHMLYSIKGKIKEVSEAVIAAEDASRVKSKFLANMSHEIRTPMNGIIGMTDLMMDEKLTGRQHQYVKDIKLSAESLLGIINDILDLSKISEGKLRITPVDTDLGTLLKNTVSMMTFSAKSKNLEFIDDIRINTPEYINADDVRLKQIIVNLLSNAIKFTKTGHVRLKVEIIGDDILFEISDTGIGIKEEDLPLIFMEFEQADIRKNRAIKGTGLGLSISKSLVELMGGRLWVESEYGVGTTFFVSIPYKKGDGTAIEFDDSVFKYIFAPTAQVLLVDDIQTNLTVGAGLLRLCGITADVAMSGAEAIELVKSKTYDIVLMDHMMPEMDGVETLEHIRSLGGKYLSLPIIALTANAVTESKHLLLSSGMDDFISKPIDKAELMNILRKWLPANKLEEERTAETEEQSGPLTEKLSAASEIDGLDIELALNRLGGLQSVLEDSIMQVAQSVSARLKNMDASLARGDLHSFSIEAHGFKGSLANIGATRNSEFAAELEIASKAENKALCEQRFTIFADEMELFAAKLRVLFSHERPKNLPEGDAEFLSLKAGEAIGYLSTFEADGAAAILNELGKYTFGDETDAILMESGDLIKTFKYKKAISLLKNLAGD